jgi:hypothetical protein
MGNQIPNVPMCQLTSLTRIGSDHNPLLLDIGGGERIGGAKQFFFERQWLNEEGFLEMVKARWETSRDKCPERAYSLDKWHGCITELRRYLKGWGLTYQEESIEGKKRRDP